MSYIEMILFHSTLLLLTISASRAQDFFPHGLEFETPVSLTPSTYEFFNSNHSPQQQHTDTHIGQACADSGCAPYPQAAEVEAAQVQEGSKGGQKSSASDGRGMSGGGVAGIVFGVVGVVFVCMGVYYVVAARRANVIRARLAAAAAQPQA
uniref:Transmembrane protein n=1 Tax=Kalanchoe fedtschenkoi TaxID=63787 RepID=A0A7N0TSZ1_KALFE